MYKKDYFILYYYWVLYMDNNFFNQNIDCDVKECKNCDYSIGKCMLISIKIIDLKNRDNDALCANFEKK